MKPLAFLVPGLWLLTGCGEISTPPPRTVSPAPTQKPAVEESGLPPEIELEELRLVVRTLAEENRRLKLEIQILRASPAPSPAVEPSASAAEPEIQTADSDVRVLYVNPHWDYLILNQGEESGLRIQQQVEILRGGTRIGRATVTEVKAAQAVADLDVDSLGASGLYPRANDRVVLP